jgi:hypothetical protein
MSGVTFFAVCGSVKKAVWGILLLVRFGSGTNHRHQLLLLQMINTSSLNHSNSAREKQKPLNKKTAPPRFDFDSF